MDEKTRSNFEMNIWNPGAVRLTDNQIYETCEDLVDSENHYCTPVPSRQTSGVLNPPLPLRSISSKSSFKYSTKKCTLVVVSLSLLLFALCLASLGCCFYVILELKRLNDEVFALREEVSSLQLTQREGMASLNASILEESGNRRNSLSELEMAFQARVVKLSEETKTNLSLLELDIQSDLGFLGSEFRENLTLIASLTSMDFMELVDRIRENFTQAYESLDRLENQTSLQISDLQENIESEISLLDVRTNQTLQQLEGLTGEKINRLNLTTVYEINRVTSDLLSLESSTISNITELANIHKSDTERLMTLHRSDTNRLEMLVNTKVEGLTADVDQESVEIRNRLASLRNQTHLNITRLENTINDSISTLTDELNRAELELALASHGNITLLSADITQTLNEVLVSIQQNISNLKAETQVAMEDFSNRTNGRLLNLRIESHSNFSSLRQSIDQDLIFFSNQTQLNFNQLGDNFQQTLDATSTSIAELNNDTKRSLLELNFSDSETREMIDHLQLVIEENITSTVRNFDNNLFQLTRDVRGSLEALNSNDTQLSSQLSLLDARLNDTFEHLNATSENFQSLVFSEVTNLSTLLSQTQETVSHTTNEVRSVNSSLQELVSETNTSLLKLEDSLEELASESYRNFTQVMSATETIEIQLRNFSQESMKNVSELTLRTERALADTLSDVSSNLVQLEANFYEALDTTNMSLHRELQLVISSTNSSISTLHEILTSELILVYNHINSSSIEVRIKLENLEAVLTDVSGSLNLTSAVVDTLWIVVSGLNDTQANTAALIENSIDRTQRSLLAQTEQIESDIRSELQSLELRTHLNLTALDSEFTYKIQRAENTTRINLSVLRSETVYEIESLRSSVKTNISQSSAGLQDTIIQLNHSFANALNISATEQENSLGKLESSIHQQLSSTTHNVSTFLGDLVSKVRDQQMTTSQSVDSLGSTVQDLTLRLETVGENASSVANQVELLHNKVQTHLNSPVDLYSQCVQDVENCTINPENSEYQSGCKTEQSDVNVPGFFTMDMRCEYTSNDIFVQLEINQLKRVGSSVRCVCDVVAITGSGNHATVNSRAGNLTDPVITCSLVMLRCPLIIL